MLEQPIGSRGGAGWRGSPTRWWLLVLVMVSVLASGAGVVVHAAGRQLAGSGAGGCFDPVAFGAVPNDGVTDRVPIQAAIDAATGAGGGTVCLAAGRWTVNRAPAGSYDRFAALSTHASHLTITGSGPGTVLDLPGDQGAATTAVISLDPGASDIVIERLSIDTSAARNTDEQTHAIEIGSGVCTPANGTCSLPVADITVRDVSFNHPKIVGERKGDCIRLAGNTPATAVQRVSIIGASFTSCARSGIGVQRNVRSLAVLGNHFGDQIGDTPFDSEPTGGGGDDGLRMIGNSFAGTSVTYNATLTTYRHVTISGNTFAGRGLFVYRSGDVVVADNTFDVTAPTSAGVIEVGNVADGVKIDNNMIRRHGVAGPTIRILPHSGGLPGPMSISNNTIIADGDSTGVYVHSGRRISIRDNDITFTGAAPDGSGIHLEAISRSMDGLVITGNTITGPLGAGGANTYYAAVRLNASPFPINDVTLALNTARAAIHSLVCSQSTASNFPVPIISVGNRWNVAPACAVATFQAGQ